MTYVRQHHFHKQKIYLGLPRIFSIDPASISVNKGLFSSKQHRSTLIHSFILNIYIAPLQENYSEALPTPARINNSLHPGYLTSLVTKTNHNTIDVYV